MCAPAPWTAGGIAGSPGLGDLRPTEGSLVSMAALVYRRSDFGSYAGRAGLSVPVLILWGRPPAVNSRLRMIPTWAPRSICCPPPARFPRAGMIPRELSGTPAAAAIEERSPGLGSVAGPRPGVTPVGADGTT